MALQRSAGLAVAVEIPLVDLRHSACGPSKAPTRRAADLLQALLRPYSEAPTRAPASTPADCFWVRSKQANRGVKYMVPVIILAERYLPMARRAVEEFRS